MSGGNDSSHSRKGLLIIAAAATFVLVVGLTGLCLWQTVRAVRAERRLQAETARGRAVDGFLFNLIGRGARVVDENDGKTIRANLRLQSSDLGPAETMFREVLLRQKAEFPNGSPEVLQTLGNLAALLEQRGDLAGAEATRREALTVSKQLFGESSSQFADATGALAELLERRGNLPGAAILSRGLWEQAVGRNPKDQLNYYRLIALLVQMGDQEAARKQARAMLEQFGATEDPVTAERTARSLLLIPVSGADLEAAVKLAAIPVERAEPANKDMTYFEMVKGLAEYRMGRATNALEWIDKCLAHGPVWGKQFDSSREVVAYAIQGMARYQLGQKAQALESLTQAEELLQSDGPKLLFQSRGTLWVDWATCYIFVREAKALVGARE